ncbi:Zinc finger protein brutus-like [Thalictrum thalictroides]|uniref:Zinc finger protein brutus-like n=1 Tax=Thalictrum thalictroides TaxID=46969 RepID=A0A7J6VLU7_THATH|nr:Zinc finger protein brutus-like [Thalictrum thalictroides]
MVGGASSVRVVDAPILLFVCFHNGLRAELDRICILVSSFSLENCSRNRDLVIDLHNKFQFLKIVYKYHCAAEDEIIFQALAVRASNVVRAYSLEHRGIDDLFDSVFQSLHILLEEHGNFSKEFQELVYCIATMQTSICQNMLKEEEQVFPLLVERFSFEEQASLVWQCFCSIPIILLEDFLPWMTSYIPKDDLADVVHCIIEIVPKENVLQEVVASWLGKERQPSSVGFISSKDEVSLWSVKSLYLTKFKQVHLSWASLNKDCIQGYLHCPHDDAKHHPVDILHLWHGAIKKGLREVLEKLYQIKSLNAFSSLASIGGQVKFLVDVLIFYSDALEYVFYSVLNEFANGCLLSSYKRFPHGSHIEGLLFVLQNINSQSGTSLCELVEELCQQLDALFEGICKHFTFQEFEVLPLIYKHCNHEMQRSLFYVSLHIMPLGLLKCAITWFSSHLNEDESKAVLCSINMAGSGLDMSLASLVQMWVCHGYSGDRSHEPELQKMFKNPYLSKTTEERTCFVDVDGQPCEKIVPGQVKPISANKVKKGALHSSSQNSKEKNIILYSSEINLQIYFPDFLRKLSPFSKDLVDRGDAGSSLIPELKPIDYIFLFHKALTNDLNHLVLESKKMAENVALLGEFRHRFHLVRMLYEIHSDNEDQFAFPALEAKGKLENICGSYTIDHKLEEEYFNQISAILDEISELHVSLPSDITVVMDATYGQRMLKYRRLCIKLQGKCKTICITLGKHFEREESELWPLFTECFSDEEQDKIIGLILGNTRAEVLQQMIPWLMASLSSREQQAMLSVWRNATKNTKFDEWLAEWWEGMSKDDIASATEESNSLPSWTVDPLDIVATYLCKESQGKLDGSKPCDKILTFEPDKSFANCDGDNKTESLIGDMGTDQWSDLDKHQTNGYEQKIYEVTPVTDQVKKSGDLISTIQKFGHLEEHILTMSQEDFEAAIRRVYRDTSIDPQKKSYITQTLRTSRWTVTQLKHHQEIAVSSNEGGIPGQCPSYRNPTTFGCKHYKRNCKVFAACCNQLVTCRYCHDDTTDHTMDRKSTTKMMCMKCLTVQPVVATCSNISCNGLSMAKYFCSICRLYEDEREIYHCPYCNICRVGKGLGIDFFHCMNCNACMSKSLEVHICREKCFESNCPICHEDIFTSSTPVKALPCGHLMHSTCFQDYTCMHYTCPICSKSLGDMQVYFRMLDALLSEEKTPEEYHGQTQVILCNDCEKRGVAPFHWLYHKCSSCASYNTRLL